jgi:hypothetical protein
MPVEGQLPDLLRVELDEIGRPVFSAGRGRSLAYRTSSPVTVRPISIRWISLVPSKIVKIVDYGAVSAGQWPE